MVYILNGKVPWLRLMAIIWTASSDAARQACGKAAARWGNAQAVTLGYHDTALRLEPWCCQSMCCQVDSASLRAAGGLGDLSLLESSGTVLVTVARAGHGDRDSDADRRQPERSPGLCRPGAAHLEGWVMFYNMLCNRGGVRSHIPATLCERGRQPVCKRAMWPFKRLAADSSPYRSAALWHMSPLSQNTGAEAEEMLEMPVHG
jgi:hypothetical protein